MKSCALEVFSRAYASIITDRVWRLVSYLSILVCTSVGICNAHTQTDTRRHNGNYHNDVLNIRRPFIMSTCTMNTVATWLWVWIFVTSTHLDNSQLTTNVGEFTYENIVLVYGPQNPPNNSDKTPTIRYTHVKNE